MIKEIQDNDFNIDNLINDAKEKFPKIYELWKDKKDLSMLDLGCRFPMTMFICYHIFDFTTFVGVDEKNNETNILVAHLEDCIPKIGKDIEQLKKMESCNNFFELYTTILTAGKEDKNPQINSQVKFNNLFLDKFYFETDIIDYLKKTRRKFDFINLSNILHFFDSKKEVEYILNRVLKLLKPNGILHICINSNYPDFDNNFMKELLNKNFEKGYIIQCQKEKCIETHFINVDYK
jgi:SAM-dependent methyltransferase